MTFSFVPAREEDAATIAALRQAIWSTTYRGIYPDEAIDRFDYALHERQDLERIRSEAFAVYLIRADQTDAGYFILQFSHPRFPLYIQSLYLLPEYRRHGIGTSAFRMAADCCRERGFPRFGFSCNEHNLPARRFYASIGAKELSRDAGHANRQLDQILYRVDVP